MFGSEVCVKRSMKRREKLDCHDFMGVFIRYSATMANVRYIDLTLGIVKTCSHTTTFDEASYFSVTRPPEAQLFYNFGLEQ